MLEYYPKWKKIEKNFARQSDSINSAYERILGFEKANRIRRLAGRLLRNETIVSSEGYGFLPIIAVKKSGRTAKFEAAPVIRMPVKGDGKELFSWIHEFNHFSFFAMQKFPMIVAEGHLGEMLFGKDEEREFFIRNFKNEKDEKSIDKFVGGLLSITLYALEEDATIYLTRRIMKEINGKDESLAGFYSGIYEDILREDTIDWTNKKNFSRLYESLLDVCKRLNRDALPIVEKHKKDIERVIRKYDSIECRKIPATNCRKNLEFLRENPQSFFEYSKLNLRKG